MNLGTAISSFIHKIMLRLLTHTEVSLPNGGKVILLKTGAVIGAEEEAMLQALHSRSIGGIRAHLQQLIKYGAAKFMRMFYVGYGHKSIGDCGSATIFIEGVSMLAAKAIQDTPLYNGQEASTRYIPFDKQPFYNPATTADGDDILERQRNFYLHALQVMQKELLSRYPYETYGDTEASESRTKYKKAINARAFDITQCFLPAGASTNLSWHTTLRQFSDRLLWLRNHPLEEVRAIAEAIEEALLQMYPNSFSKKTVRGYGGIRGIGYVRRILLA